MTLQISGGVDGTSNSTTKSDDNSATKNQFTDKWRHRLAKFALCFFGVALWYKGLSYYSYALLILAWILDHDLHRLRATLKEPFVVTVIYFCFVLALGVLWSDYPQAGYIRWNKYFTFLLIIPYLSLLTKTRIPWAIGGLLLGYVGILLLGVYHWAVLQVEGIPWLKMTYLRFSLTVGIGVILALYFAAVCNNKKIKYFLWSIAILMLYVQFNQDGRGPLLTTVATATFLIFLLYKTRIRVLLRFLTLLIAVIVIFSVSSERFQQRVALAQQDIEMIQQGKFATDVGYRLAIWDIGLHAIAKRPFFGYGTGMALATFEKYVDSYKDGRYQHIWKEPRFHYHNDWIEIGVFVGAFGLSAFVFFLWGWFKSLQIRKLTIFGQALVCYVFFAGLTDIFLAYTGLPLLIIAITAVAIGWRREDFDFYEIT